MASQHSSASDQSSVVTSPGKATQSQEIESQAVQELVQKCKNQIASERQKGEKDIEKARKQRIEGVQKQLESYRKKHREKIRGIKAPLIKEIRELMERKRILEEKLKRSHREVDDAFESSVEQFRSGVKHRVEAVSN